MTKRKKDRKFVVVTGACGTIGTVLCGSLKNKYCAVLPFDNREDPNLDLSRRGIGRFTNFCMMADVIVHLAWDSRENWKTDITVPANWGMVESVFYGAIGGSVKRVIMASSIHADNFHGWHGPGLMNPFLESSPKSPYGQTKVRMEQLGKYFAEQYKLQVICLRLGGVTLDNKLRNEPLAEKIWLHTEDCVSLVKACVDAPEVPGNFCIMYAVSNNTGRIHDISNPFGWVPKHDFAK
ncbi:MAG TPA: NAD(P)-dependent oxidoreductase [Negativicutes bacterium]|nr:NAD(P)-dependent oxidoreductase [Negativicutes bacterium]